MKASEFAVLWDVDGTLVDTAEQHFRAWNMLAAEIGKIYSREDFANTFGWRNPEIIPRVFGDHYTAKEIDALGERKEAYYRKDAARGLEPLPGVLDLVRSLHEAGFKQAIGSSAPRENVEMILDQSCLRPYLGAVIAMEDVARGKPDPLVFLLGAQRLGVEPSRCVVFEDAPVGIQAAKSAGMKAIGVTFVGHHSRERLEAGGADLVVECLTHVNVDTVRELLDSCGRQ
ncbi:MAG: HAD family phosphatase [Gemmataceae bacterium]|nr:HAD family phosphatase [Gemmataceae bacterium]